MNEAGGRKDDQQKTRYDLVPTYSLEQWARVLTFGAQKYEDRNWEKGIHYGRCYAALLRHMTAWWGGEDIDPESSLPHLAHAMCCVGFLLHYSKHNTDMDDRPVYDLPTFNVWDMGQEYVQCEAGQEYSPPPLNCAHPECEDCGEPFEGCHYMTRGSLKGKLCPGDGSCPMCVDGVCCHDGNCKYTGTVS